MRCRQEPRTAITPPGEKCRLVVTQPSQQLIADPLLEKTSSRQRYLFGIDPFEQTFADIGEICTIDRLLQCPGFVHLERAPVSLEIAAPQQPALRELSALFIGQGLITVAGLFSQNIYGTYMNPQASEQQRLRVTRMGGLIVALVSFAVAILMRHSIVKAILDYFNILSLIGMSVALGLVWRRMNSTGVFCSTIVAGAAFIISRYLLQCPRSVTIGIPLALGLLGAVVGSLLSKAPASKRIEDFFKRIYTPIGEEYKLDWPLDKVVSPSARLLTWGGLFLVKPSGQSKVGFLIALALCILCVVVMWALLNL